MIVHSLIVIFDTKAGNWLTFAEHFKEGVVHFKISFSLVPLALRHYFSVVLPYIKRFISFIDISIARHNYYVNTFWFKKINLYNNDI